MAAALAALPWVEPASIHADRTARQVQFAVKDPAAFDESALKETIRRAGYSGARRLVGPTAAAPANPSGTPP